MQINDPERQLVERIAEGEEDAFSELYAATSKKVLHYLYRVTRNQEMAEDILSESYIEVWRTASRFRGESKVTTWIIGIARNVAMNAFRKNNKAETELNDEIVTIPAQFAEYSASQSVKILGNAINKLSSSHREVLDLVFMEGMHYEEVAYVMKIPVNTVKTRVFYAKEKLRDIFSGMGVGKNDIV